MNRLPIDQLNIIKPQIESMFANGNRPDPNDVVDTVLDLLIMSYLFGAEDAEETLGVEIAQKPETMQAVIYRKIAGKDFAERIREYAESADTEAIFRVAETDTTRIYNEALLETADQSGKAYRKRWQTMEDDRVRDTHDYLQGVTVGKDERFYTYDADSARYPGDFALPENNVNCRCYVELIAE